MTDAEIGDGVLYIRQRRMQACDGKHGRGWWRCGRGLAAGGIGDYTGAAHHEQG